MPIEIRAIRERRKVLTVELGEGASLEMEYLPAKASGLDREALERLAAENAGKSEREQRRALAGLVCEIVTRWDVTEDGEPFPLDPDAMAREFDDAFLAFCLGAAYQDAQQSKSNGELLKLLGTVSTSQTAGGNNSPVTKAAACRPISNSPRSHSKTASRRGN